MSFLRETWDEYLSFASRFLPARVGNLLRSRKFLAITTAVLAAELVVAALVYIVWFKS